MSDGGDKAIFQVSVWGGVSPIPPTRESPVFLVPLDYPNISLVIMAHNLSVKSSNIFLLYNDIQLTRTPPKHPATNGLVERYVGYWKVSLKKIKNTSESIQSKIDLDFY